MEDKNSILRIFSYANVKRLAGIKKTLRHNEDGCKEEKMIMQKHGEKLIEELKKTVK